MMKKIAFLFVVSLLAVFSSCNSEDDFLNSFPTLDDVQYSFYVAEALDAMNMPRPEGSYNFPCLPGMPRWKELSIEERRQVCHVPDKILKKQSTQAVIQAMWEHPDFKMLIGFSSHSHLQVSLDRVLPDWDIYRELTERSDAASCLVERYYRMNPTNISHVFYLNTLQLILSQTVFLDQLSLDEKVQLAKGVAEKIDVVNKIEDTEEKDFLDVTAYFCLVRIMANSQYSPMLDWIKEDELVEEFESMGGPQLFTIGNSSTKILELNTNFVNGN